MSSGVLDNVVDNVFSREVPGSFPGGVLNDIRIVIWRLYWKFTYYKITLKDILFQLFFFKWSYQELPRLPEYNHLRLKLKKSVFYLCFKRNYYDDEKFPLIHA